MSLRRVPAALPALLLLALLLPIAGSPAAHDVDLYRHQLQTRPAIAPPADVVDLRRQLDRLATRRPHDPELPVLERRTDALARGLRAQHPDLLPDLEIGRRPPPRLHRGRPVPVEEDSLPEVTPRSPPEHGGLERAIAYRVSLIEEALLAVAALADTDLPTAREQLARTRSELESLVRLYGARLAPAEVEKFGVRLEALEARLG